MRRIYIDLMGIREFGSQSWMSKLILEEERDVASIGRK